MNLPTFTVFCQQADQLGTIHIDTVEATDLNSAIQAGREQCLADWNGGAAGPEAPFKLEDIHCLGVAQGDVRILHWQDQLD
ncbi:MAG: hypothetical protein EAZ84_13835 [Verrucomicrobia bacterium]|nr:MAG: hypothetical protein EAZ84_13835 [Verrucomicrobiota bacterium]